MASIENVLLPSQLGLLDQILAASTEHIYIYDRAGHYLYASPSGLAALGLEAKEVLGKSWRELNFPTDVMERHDRHRESVFQTGIPFKGEAHFPTLQGTRYYEYIISPMLGAEGKIDAVISTARDITERQQTAETLHQLNQQLEARVVDKQEQSARAEVETLVQQLEVERSRLEQILQQMSIGVAIAEAPSGKLLFHNEEAVRLLRHPLINSDTYQGYIRYGALHADGQPYQPDEYPIARSLLSGEVVKAEEMHYRRGDGTTTLFSVNAAPIVNQDGQVVSAVSTFEDISDRKTAQLNEQFLTDLDRCLRQLSDADAMVWEAISRIRKYLNVERCVWHEVNVQEDRSIVTQDWRRDPDISSVIGVTRLSESILPDMIAQFHAGQPAVVPDVTTHPYTAPFAQNFAERDIRAFVGIPCLYEGHWVAVLAINARTAQAWRPDQVALLQDVVARLWSMIEHTRAVQVLGERERLFSTLAEALPVTIFRFDASSNCTYINNYWTTMTGRTIASVMGLGWVETLHSEDRDRLVSAWLEWSQNVQQQRLYQNEGRLVHVNGQDVWYYIQALPEVNDKDEIIGYIGVMTDITQRKQSEVAILQLNQELRQRVTELQTLLDVIPVGIGIAEDSECHHIRVNPAFADVLGIPPTVNASLSAPEAERPTTFKVYQNGRELAPEELPLQYAAAHGVDIRDLEVDVVWQDGTTVTLLEYAAPLLDESGQPRGSVGAFLNITDRKRAEAALRESQEQLERQVQERTQELREANALLAQREQEFRTLVENTPDVITRHDRQYRYLYVNPARAKLANIPLESYLGKKPSELGYSEEMGQFLEASLEDAFVTGEMRIDEITVFSLNEPRSYQVYVVPERDSNHFITSVMTIGRDVTRLRQTEETARKLAEELQRSNQELEQFAYIASHDLQEPLRAITSFTQLLAKEYQAQLDGDADMYIEFIVDGATRMQQLIRDLLNYSRVGRYELQLQPIDCNAILERVKKDLQVAISENQAMITADPLPTITADPNQMTHLLQNLISNSLKYRSEADPRIHISAKRQIVAETIDSSHNGSSQGTREPEEWLFSLQDNGIGIEPQYAQRIFGIFQRLHTSDEYPGTGLGLAICQKIVERHEGRIWVESQLGQGATFFFTIPLSMRTHDGNSRPITQNSAG